ncbi:acetylornithine deacetylase [Fodinicurvata sp. EGI_FJ10296]|uniref:acetylornithine deacetylase n=1 Tax=Fodinicurvata sp. EGI_FJ10296 TaxID=3231908 RepID=UPI00345442CE
MPTSAHSAADTTAASTASPSPDTLEWLRTLVGFPTVSRDSNLDLIHHVRDRLAELGVESVVLPREDGFKANLWARIGPDAPGGVALSGHTDVVPVDGQNWTSDPFILTERDGLLYGRGSADMKGFIACVLSKVPSMKAAGLKAPIDLCFSYDEEVGCLGVDGLIAHIGTLAHKPDWVLVGEPTGMGAVTGHKGKLAMACTVRGRTGHSSLAPHAVNAVQIASRLVAMLADMADEAAAKGVHDDRYDLPHTTVHVGQIEGGRALNIVPDECRFEFEVRHLAVDDPMDTLTRLQAYADTLIEQARDVAPEASVTWEPIFKYDGLDMPEDAEPVRTVQRLARTNTSSRVAYGTEGGKFQAIGGLAAVVCGPGHIIQAHKADEFIDPAQLAAMEGFLDRLIAEQSE